MGSDQRMIFPLSIDCNIARIFGVRLSMSLGMACVMSIVYPFWTSNGLSSGDIVVLKVALLSSILVCELPSGVIADYLGRRHSLFAAGGMLLGGECCYLVGNGFTEFLVGELLIAMGVSLVTGTDQAALFESLRRSGRSHEFGRYFGSLRALEMVLSAGVALCAGHMFSAWDRLPFLAAFCCFLLLACLSLGLKSPAPTASSSSPEGSSIGQTLAIFPRNRATLAILAFTAFAFGLGPVLKTFSQAFLAMHGVPVQQFGYAPAVGLFTGALIGVLAHRILQHLGQRRSLVFIAAIYVAALSGLALGTSWLGQIAIAAFMANEVFATITLSKLIQEEIGDAIRATVMSVAGMGSRACSLFILFFFRKDGHQNLQAAFLLMTLVTAVAFLVLLCLRFTAIKNPQTRIES